MLSWRLLFIYDFHISKESPGEGRQEYSERILLGKITRPHKSSEVDVKIDNRDPSRVCLAVYEGLPVG